MKNSNRLPAGFSFQLDEFYLDLREDGRSIKFLGKDEIEKRPFPGLRPFRTSEFQLFNGRDGQAEELINRLKKNHFLSVIGSSGTGKSSLIRAGLVPQLLAGYLHEAGTNWDIAICRPGKDPVENLSIAFARIKARSNNKEEIINEYNLVEPLLRRSIYGILEVNELLNPADKLEKEKTNLLIIIDQFEELFRFNRDDLKKPDIENHFVNLLLKASLNPDISIYVIITMRSEFLGDCAKYRGLPEAINEGQYLVPQLSREQIKEVIEDPILIAGKKIAPGLIELLVNEIEESKSKKDLDQLPILQHALMRTYEVAVGTDGVTEITYEHYLAAGGMENALANHAEKIYTGLADGVNKESFKQKITKIIFQALTDASTDQKRGRRPTELKILCEIAASLNANEQEVCEVINHFRDTETSFIMPPANTDLYPNLIMDISHESLMRQWSKLRDWVVEEAENGKMLLRLSQYQKLNQQGKKDYLEGKELLQMSEWYHLFKPQPDWARRYSPDYEKCFQYLEESERKWKAKKRRSKILLIAIPSIILITAYLVNMYKEAQKARDKAKTNLTILSEKRKKAIEHENKLQALIFTTELLSLKKDQNSVDSLLKNCKKNNLLPRYSLKNIFFDSSDVKKASFSPDAKTIFTWTQDGIFSELNAETGTIVRSGKYELVKREMTSELIMRDTIRLIFNISNKLPETKDTVLTDSSFYFKRKFEEVFEKDPSGSAILPQIIRAIYGSAFSSDKTQILTWGKNTESYWEAVDIWNEEGISTSISLIHDGIYGAAFSRDKNLILTWGLDSTVRVWQLTKDTIDPHMPAILIKTQIQMATGVEMNEKDYTIKIIPGREYIKRKEEFILEEKEYRHNTTGN